MDNPTVLRLSLAGAILLGATGCGPRPAVQAGAPPPAASTTHPDLTSASPVAGSAPEAGGATTDVSANQLRPTADVSNWTLEQWGGGKAAMDTDGDAVVVHITQADGKYWHVQLYQKPVALEEGHTYSLAFRAKADRPCDMPLQVLVNQDDFHPCGLSTHIHLLRQWRDYGCSFTASRVVAGNNRAPVFAIGQKPGTFWLADAVLREIE